MRVPAFAFLHPEFVNRSGTSNRRRRRLAHDGEAVPLLLYATFVLMLLLAEAIGARGWNAGGHFTPEQWARHSLLVGIGFVDHHAVDLMQPLDGKTTPTDAQRVVAFANAPVSASGLAPSEGVALPTPVDLLQMALIGVTLGVGTVGLHHQSALRPPSPPPKAPPRSS